MEILWTIYIVGASLVVGGALMLTLLAGMFTGTISVPVIVYGVLWGLAWPLVVPLTGAYYGVIEPLRDRRKKK